MKRALLLLSLASCAHRERVTWPDGSESEPVWVCSRKDAGEIGCLSGRAVIEMVVQQMPQERIDQLRLQAPDEGEK